jgi:4-hydroxybenzoate polyprenyltransferase
MIHFLKLIRWPNLLIVFLSMLFTRYLVIHPILGFEGLTSGMNTLEFTLLIVSTLLITMGGYLINDFFDMQSDSINKPGKNQVGKRFAVARIQLLYWSFTILGVLIGTLLSWKLSRLNYALIFAFAAGLLWFYSERYKCIPIVGNVVVAFLSALSFGLVWIFEFFALTQNAHEFGAVQSNFPLVHHFILIYTGFAFIVSLLREVIKDIEDVEGDKQFGCNTFAVAYGAIKAKYLGHFIALVGLTFSIWLQWFFYRAGFMILLGYFIVIDILFLTIMIWLFQATRKSDYNRLSFFIKALMVIGILSMILVYFEI